ncbi:MAG TPA: hypothetical protein VM686_35820 [Polyangiaceae bacterium]|nr:hypothetical protein [Polyangiaceae bacterium]
MKITRLLALSLLGWAAASTPASASPGRVARTVSDAITEIDLERARRLLDRADADSPAIVFERARLAVYLGECEAAAAMLDVPQFLDSKEALQLSELAQSCARATVAGLVLQDEKHGIWLRLQDDADRVLAPFIFEVAAAARDAVGRDLGVDLPRPLRIDLVRDLFSLAAVSGLPVTAAETTGTLAVARWGRVIMLSPRAAQLGYPWQDTLAHEITHLMLSRASRDNAPLWLQEGIAKREESRWRDARPFDEPRWADVTARTAMASGRSVGIDKIGPSIAMLPTPEAASTAFAEVTSFMGYFLRESGEPSFRLLLADLKGFGDDGGPDGALRSVTGYDLVQWKERWQTALAVPPDPNQTAPAVTHPEPKVDDPRELARRVRLGDLLAGRDHAAAAASEYELALAQSRSEAAVRWRLARVQLAQGDRPAAERNLGAESEVSGPNAGWLALQGRFRAEAGQGADAKKALTHALGLHPLLEDVACEGHFTLDDAPVTPLPAEPKRALCEQVSKASRD